MPKSEKSQSDKFREAARELGTDDSEMNFNARLKRVIKSSQPKEEAPPVPTRKPKATEGR
ncbi:hypothetical protein EN828_27375 [Mesorhizobium sp. M2D.F.Ca.ET.185.01.1.1]|uniref:hypothetical protein n=1 Tax=unclassified Mesorhizobium TaxID=325217 RepID=UPI000FC9A949|nr:MULTISPECIES: hypothetical protein [unclassified Mesorhizobium]TGP74802.1 hypothetical protein EN870_26410 [bacterium M00.F.Ca.ET.227.01.1.1]TGP84697.1 hypothetical protein EN864_29215 [bacterium M00.F.Ca.ET.221.01.1.1]TGP87754.1 hypothetical protein EN865_28510 [bacterium M00.F.Ca.ET.222.01.1.1]TGT70967.1 hypothetical protein EN802_21960 [bacterium M00.F.Ca.ET.159.01.1.1]TGT82610.1 hypothetical protein EN800_20120 [bacterium M00.F.Ca.ET.157.01.1.1]TGT97166.1 hypothetical protein EN806_503